VRGVGCASHRLLGQAPCCTQRQYHAKRTSGVQLQVCCGKLLRNKLHVIIVEIELLDNSI